VRALFFNYSIKGEFMNSLSGTFLKSFFSFLLLLSYSMHADDTSDVGESNITRTVTNACGRVLLSGSNPITISSPGAYCLDSDVPAITVAADYVDLDLGAHRVAAIISSANNHIQIANGFVTGPIQVINGADIALSNIVVDGAGITCNGTQRPVITNCTVTNAATGFAFSNVSWAQLRYCTAIHNRAN